MSKITYADVTKSKDELVTDCLHKIDENKEFPDKILLTGNYVYQTNQTN